MVLEALLVTEARGAVILHHQSTLPFFTQLLLHKAAPAAVVQCPVAASVRSNSKQVHPLMVVVFTLAVPVGGWLSHHTSGC